MVNIKTFTGWAVDRAEKIVSDQAMDLLMSGSPDSPRSKEQCLLRLTVAILDALIEARNFERNTLDPRMN